MVLGCWRSGVGRFCFPTLQQHPNVDLVRGVYADAQKPQRGITREKPGDKNLKLAEIPLPGNTISLHLDACILLQLPQVE